MVNPRGKPFVWVTWLTPALAGEAQCAFAPWFKAHFQYQKRADRTFDLAAWSAEHTALLEQRGRDLEAEGWIITLENTNAFRLYGKTATLAGKPDLIARRDGETLVVDAKTGQQRNRDWWQVLIYLAVLPRVFPVDAARLSGEVCYREHRIPIVPAELTDERERHIWAVIRAVGDNLRPGATPSATECAFCDLGTADCPSRIEAEVSSALVSEF